MIEDPQCIGCGCVQDDYQFCHKCQRAFNQYHPGPGCPCFTCKTTESNRRIKAKLKAAGVECPEWLK